MSKPSTNGMGQDTVGDITDPQDTRGVNLGWVDIEGPRECSRLETQDTTM